MLLAKEIKKLVKIPVIGNGGIKNAEDAFALRVQGDSMIDAGIFEGDLVIVSPDDKGKNGDAR